MRQTGFIQLAPMAWAAIAAAVIIAGLGIALKVQSARLDACKAEYAQFQAEVKVLGEAAVKAAKAKEAADKLAKEKTDAQRKLDRNRIASLSRQLRDANANRSTVSQLPITANSPNITAFDRAELDRAIQDYQSRLLGVVEKGAEAIVDLDSAKDWIKEVK